MEAAVARELHTEQENDASAGVRHGWCGVSTDNILHGSRRSRKQASNIWLDPQGPCADLRKLLLKDVGDEIRSAAHDEDFQDDESVRTSDEEDRSDRDGATEASDESDGSSGSGNESESDSDSESNSDSESDGDYTTASEISDASSAEESDDSSSMDEEAYGADGEGETDQWASDCEDEDAMDEDELELDLQGLTLLEMDYAEFDDFVADLDPERWRKRPHELTDCWTDRRRAWLAGGHIEGK